MGEELGGADPGKGCPFLVYPVLQRERPRTQISRRQSVSDRHLLKITESILFFIIIKKGEGNTKPQAKY